MFGNAFPPLNTMRRRTHSIRLDCFLLGALCLAPSIAAAQGHISFDEARNRMVEEEIIGGGVKNPRVIQAMRDTPRHEFVPLQYRQNAYYDMSLPIGDKQTISGPFVVAYMTEQLDPQPTDRVLEIGTGSGYQAAVLSPLVKDVYTIEIVEALGKHAEQTLEAAEVQQRARQNRRRLSRLARARAVRQNHRHLLA